MVNIEKYKIFLFPLISPNIQIVDIKVEKFAKRIKASDTVKFKNIIIKYSKLIFNIL